MFLAGASGTISIERQLEDGLAAQVTDLDGRTVSFVEEKGFSSWLIDRLEIPERQFASRNDSEIVSAYMSVLAPVFWVDQDLGWRLFYSPLPTHNFIRDQADEIPRWLLGLPAKHRPVDKTDFARAKQNYEAIQEQIAIKRNTLGGLRRELGEHIAPDGRGALASRRDVLIADLRARSSVLQVLSQSGSVADARISDATAERESAAFAVASAERRFSDLRALRKELEAEVEILETNEVAAGAFRTLCGNEGCQFFRNPEESYGRRLLYLKDQLKDFDSSFSTMEQDLGRFRSDLTARDSSLQAAIADKQRMIAETPEARLIEAVDTITKQLSDVNLRLEQLERLSNEEGRLNELINRGLRAEEEVNELRPTRGRAIDQARLTDARVELARSFTEWLVTLKTPNAPSSVKFDEDLRLFLGEERFSEVSSHSGSTRTRIVLAYHAAVLETSLKMNGYHPRFLILDTPKQHELHADDLRAFVERFNGMANKHNPPIQLVIAATQHDFVADKAADTVWRPQFHVEDGVRFFGPSQEIKSGH